MDMWTQWHQNLTDTERTQYSQMFPPPIGWTGFWNPSRVAGEAERDRTFVTHNKFFTQFWRDGGKPKYSRETISSATEFLVFSDDDPQFPQHVRANIMVGPRSFTSPEQYMMLSKAEMFNDTDSSKALGNCSAQELWTVGRRIRNFDQGVWDRFKYSIVLNANWRKFSQKSEFKDLLLATGEKVLVFASPNDVVWGVGLSPDAPDVRDPKRWRGENLLGFALMEVRDELRRIFANESICDWTWKRSSR